MRIFTDYFQTSAKIDGSSKNVNFKVGQHKYSNDEEVTRRFNPFD